MTFRPVSCSRTICYQAEPLLIPNSRICMILTQAPDAAGSATALDALRDPCIRLRGVGLRYQGECGETEALSNIDLDIAEGEFVAFLGPTGCGKSSLLRLVSDLIEPTSGTVAIRGGPAIAARRANGFGFVFQDPALLSWRSALGNVQLPLEVVGYPVEQRRAPFGGPPRSGGVLKIKGSPPH